MNLLKLLSLVDLTSRVLGGDPELLLWQEVSWVVALCRSVCVRFFAMDASRYTLGGDCLGCSIKMDLVHLQILYNSFIFHASRSSIKVVCLKDCVLFCTWLHHNVWLGCDIDRRRNGRPHDWGVLLLSQDGHLLLLLSEDGHWWCRPTNTTSTPATSTKYFWTICLVFEFNVAGVRLPSRPCCREVKGSNR